MAWLSSRAWRALSRPFDLQDANELAVGTVRGVFRPTGEQEDEGGASYYTGVATFRKADLDASSISLERYMRVSDPQFGSLFSIVGIRLAVGPGGATLVKADLEGIR